MLIDFKIQQSLFCVFTNYQTYSQSIHYSLIKITYVTSKPNLKKYHAKEENFVKSEQERPEIRIIQRNETSLKNLSVT